MATSATTSRDQESLLQEVRRALHDLLPAVEEVEAAYVVLDGPHATVRAVVERADLRLVERLVDLSYELDARAPGLSFGVQPVEHQGRGVASMAWAGSSPDYVRSG